MKNIWKIIRNDFRHISTNVVALVLVIGLCVLPSLYAWFNIFSNWNPYEEDATSNLNIAVISKDKGVTMSRLQICVGDSIVEALGENNTIGWIFPEDERTAINGVYDGKYYAALVIPEDFTENIASIAEGNLNGGTITYYENEKRNAIATKITSKAQTAVETQINRTVFSTITEIMYKIGDSLENIEEQGSIRTAAVQKLERFEQDIKRNISALNAIGHATDSAKDTITALNKLSKKMVSDLQKDLSLLSTGSLQFTNLQAAGIRLADYAEVLEKGSNSLKQSKRLLKELQSTVRHLKKEIMGTEDSEEFQNILSALAEHPETIGSYFSSPIELQTVPVYETENYGSAMTPFYSVLAIWVGALILVAVIHTKVHPDNQEKPFKTYEEFFGRYAVFFLIGQLQTLICVLGNLLFLEIQCQHPFLFWFASAVSSFVFTLLIYSLVFVFGNVGEALAVIIMVIQVAGTGGTFPAEVLPMVYQKMYQFLPFPYCMTALRECVAGMYKNDYWTSLGKLMLFAVAALAVGLLLKKPFRGINERIEKSKEKSDLMI